MMAPVTAFGVFSTSGGGPRVGSRSGELVVDLAPIGGDLAAGSLDRLLVAGARHWRTRPDARASCSRAATTSTASATSRPTCRSRSPTTSTSTRRASTRRTSGGCSGRTTSRCSRTGCTCRSATTAVRGRSS